MQKQYVGIGVLVLVVIAAGWYFVSLNEPKAAPVVTPVPVTPATTTDVATSTTSAPTTPDEIELDLSKLQGKDRLYTEEEGKYENLSAEERKMITGVVCKEYEWMCNKDSGYWSHLRLVSLHNEVATIYTIADGALGALYLFDIRNKNFINWYRDSGNIAFGPNYLIKLDYVIVAEKINKWTLWFYKPGMTDFVQVPGSDIDIATTTASYLSNANFVTGSFPVDFDGNNITAYLHTFKNCVDLGSAFAPSTLNCEVASKTPVTFDLSNLP
jgi:hypothetical protein